MFKNSLLFYIAKPLRAKSNDRVGHIIEPSQLLLRGSKHYLSHCIKIHLLKWYSSFAISSILFSFALIANPFIVGVSRFKVRAIEDKGNISDMGYGFDVNYKRNVGTILLMEIYTFLWSLLFVIPGIVKMYEYSMIPYILADNPDVDRKEAFSISKEMMKGNKWRAFILDLSFILWDFLGTITGGIVTLFYVGPYRELTKASLYKAIKVGE